MPTRRGLRKVSCGRSAPTSFARRSILHSGPMCSRRHLSVKKDSTSMLGVTQLSTGTYAETLLTSSRGKAGFNGTADSPSGERLCVSWEKTSGANAELKKVPGWQSSAWPKDVWPTSPAWHPGGCFRTDAFDVTCLMSLRVSRCTGYNGYRHSDSGTGYPSVNPTKRTWLKSLQRLRDKLTARPCRIRRSTSPHGLGITVGGDILGLQRLIWNTFPAIALMEQGQVVPRYLGWSKRGGDRTKRS